ncbi:MAG: cysteine desulfurase [Desulfobacterales bacterium]|nr:cysteine desulfurase [Desulfobacterales bacterium]
MNPPIYLDYNGTTPHDPEVIAAMRPFLETDFGNPSSSHWYGATPREAVARARQQVAALLGCSPEEVFFTSGGTESNNHAIMGTARFMKARGRHIITSNFEHPAVLEVGRYLEKEGFETTLVPVDKKGLVDPADVAAAVRADTILISIMHANNEVGTIQPISDIAGHAREHGIWVHTDAAQSMGKIPVRVDQLNVDLLTVAGHKLYAPKGVGALYVRQSLLPDKFCHGAGQEMGWRAGTENVLAIVGLGKACEIAARDHQRNYDHMLGLRDRLHRGLATAAGETRLNGHPDKRLPNTLSLAFKGLEANRILAKISSAVAASPGAACHSNTVSISHVLEAMQVSEKWARGTIRFSVGKMTTEDQIDTAIEIVRKAVKSIT